MAKLTGLMKRGGTYHLRVMVPLDLRPAHEGRSKIIRALNTSNRHEASLKGHALRAQWLARFEDLRGRPTDAHSVALPSSEPVATPPSAKQHHPSLRQVFNAWQSVGERTRDSVQACNRALKQFESTEGELPVKDIAYEHGARFRTHLLGSGLAQKTARDYFVWVHALLRFAKTDMATLTRDPWARLNIEKPRNTPRRPWRTDELQRLFAQDLFTSYRLPTDPKAGKHAAYWIPLLGLFTGARVSELAQLRIGDVCRGPSSTWLAITDEGDGQQLKTSSSKRQVPIHPELIRLGFMSYVTDVGGRPEDPLWPHLPLRKGKPGGYFSQWFGEFRRKVIDERYPDFHCFRHTVRTQLAEARYPESVKDRITGHAVKGSVGTRTYEHTTHLIEEAVRSVQYPDLSLPRIYRP